MTTPTFKRKLFQTRVKITNGFLLGVLKRKTIDDELLEGGFIDSLDDLDIWREELIVELYDKEAALFDMETFPEENIYSKIKTAGVSDEEVIGFLEAIAKTKKDNEKLLKARAFLIKKLYNELPHVKDFNDIVNGLETEGEEQ